MQLKDYIKQLPSGRSLSDVKMKILSKLWGKDSDSFPKPWVSSDELLKLTGQKYFDRRTRELRDQLGCDIESSYRQEFSGHAWRLQSSKIAPPQNRDYLTNKQKEQLFHQYSYACATCGTVTASGLRGLQADHKIPLSRGGDNAITNWQPLCNNCNVGKRRACVGCTLDCQSCSWAFPEKVGIPALVSLDEETLRKAQNIMDAEGLSLSELIHQAVETLSRGKSSGN